MISFKVSSATRANNRGIGKPNEDLLCVDDAHGMFLMLDGITRPNEEYTGDGYSAACSIDRIMRDGIMPHAETLYNIKDDAETETELRRVILGANESIKDFRSQRTDEEWQYSPGAVGIAAIIKGDRLLCVWAGDCIGLHFRDGVRTLITRQQTLKVAKSGYSRDRIYAEVCNHPESEFAYGIFNGDSQLEMLLESSWTQLRSGDVILLSSDGMATFLQKEPVERIANMQAEDMLTESAPYDVPPFYPYADDKAVIRIEII